MPATRRQSPTWINLGWCWIRSDQVAAFVYVGPRSQSWIYLQGKPEPLYIDQPDAVRFVEAMGWTLPDPPVTPP